MKMDTAISVKNVSKKYKLYNSPKDRLKEAFHPRRKKYHRDFWALQDISFDVPKGTTMGIIGQNGCGKSTLLQIICGILQASSGHVKTNGRISALLELGTGFNPDFTGRQNVYMSGAVKGFTKKEMDERFDDIVSFADIGDFIKQPVKTYSSGMYVRLAFACAVNVDPDILVIDEALAVGDDMFKRRCYRKLEDFKKQGKTILFVSHSLGTITSMCDRGVLLDKGKMVQVGKPKDVVKTYNRILHEREEALAKRLGSDKNQKDERFQKPEAVSMSECRFGTGHAELLDIKILNKKGASVIVFVTGENYLIDVTAVFRKDVEAPVIGFTVKTLNGVEVFGTSTFIANCPIGPVKAGTIVKAEFEQKMQLNPGSYSLTLAIAELVCDNSRIFLDRRMDVIVFKVIAKKASYGLVNVDTAVRLTVCLQEGNRYSEVTST